MNEKPKHENDKSTNEVAPVRGSLRLQVNTSNPRVSAGSHFSIFVTIQNPFDVPITVYQVETHIPVELMDINAVRIAEATEQSAAKPNRSPIGWLADAFRRRRRAINAQTGIAIAIATNFAPEQEREFIKSQVSIGEVHGEVAVSGVQLVFPENPTSEDLDRIFQRIADYKKGLIPATLQPGDSVVRQFVLRTRRWLFFTPLSHAFQMQVNYSVDGVDHSDTVPYQLSISSTLLATTIGAITGSVLGATLRTITSLGASQTLFPAFTGVLAAILASIAVVVAFARKSNAQPMVSVEDFWGGALIGVSVGYFGFEQFMGLFSP